MARALPRDPWAGGRLHLVLAHAYGVRLQPSRRVLAADVAAAAGVTAGTVRRWLRRLPASRRRELEERLLPDAAQLEQEQRELAYAREALDEIRRDDPRNPGWEEQGWLEPHVLAIVALEQYGVCVARIARASGDPRARERLRAGGGVVIDQEVFTTRFDAKVAKGELLEFVARWRLVLPPGTLPRGRTETWLKDAPRRTAAWLADNPKAPRRVRGRAGVRRAKRV